MVLWIWFFRTVSDLEAIVDVQRTRRAPRLWLVLQD